MTGNADSCGVNKMKTRFFFSPPFVVTVAVCALVLGFSPPTIIHAAPIYVGCDVTELISAINTANANPDADILELSANCAYTLTSINNTDASFGPNGLPIITSNITLHGNNATIGRAADAPAFRLIQINMEGVLTTNELTLTDGDAGTDANGNGWNGGAIHNRGVCNLDSTNVADNHAGDGIHNEDSAGTGGHGGALVNYGTAALNNSFLHNNRAGSGACSAMFCYSSASSGDGGAIYNLGTLTLANSELTDNETTDTLGNRGGQGVGSGGAIYNGGELTMSSSALAGNKTGNARGYMFGDHGGSGGALYNKGNVNIFASALTENRTGAKYGNEPRDAAGGAIYNDASGELFLNNVQFSANGTGMGGFVNGVGMNGGSGGAIANSGSAQLENTVVDSNTSGNGGDGIVPGRGGDGGAIHNTGTMQLLDNTLAKNRTGSGGYGDMGHGDGGHGGALFNDGTLELHRSTITENSTGNGGEAYKNPGGNGGSGGGIYNNGTATLVNSTLRANKTGVGNSGKPKGSGGNGGGIANLGALTLTHVTLNRNGVGAQIEPGKGGAIFNAGGAVKLQNSILANSLESRNCYGGVMDGGGNVRYPETDNSCVGKFGAPNFGALQDNGGATQTLALAPDSAAINAALETNCPATDQRGIARPQGKRCDSGAFELEPPTPFTLRAPLDEKHVKPQVNLQWNASEHLVFYRVLVRMDSAKGAKIVNHQVTTTNYQTPALERGHWYYWRIKACSRVGCAATQWWSFRVRD